jgi:hypothetical protein
MSNNLTEKPKQSNDKKTSAEPVGFVIIPKIMVDQLTHFSGSSFKVYIAVKSVKPGAKTGKRELSLPDIETLSGVKVLTIKKVLKELEAFGLILRHKSPGEKNQYSFPGSTPGISSRGDSSGGSFSKTFTDTYLENQQNLFPGIKVREVLSKFLTFCEENGRTPNKRYFESWLRKEDIPMIIDDEEFEKVFGEK